MAERKATKKRLSINLSFLSLTDPRKLTTAQKSPPKNTTPKNGVVGLGILAALDNQDPPHLNGSPKMISSNPLPILTKIHHGSSRNLSVELCEEYTCVISRVGDNLVNKREYFEVDFLGNTVDDNSNKGGGTNDDDDDFLSSCFLCRKMLHGLDIFMYRGEKAFCSAECRCRQISIDEKKDKCRGRVRKPMEHSASPTLQFFAGVAAA